MASPNQLIGIFDSGVGGFSVLNAIRRHILAQPIIYLADQAHVPYGERQMDEIRDFSRSITSFLLEKGAQLIVVACNTASAAALLALREEFPDTPFVGMEPAVKPATLSTKSRVVGVLATPATFQSELYASVIERFARDVTVLRSTCPGLVAEIESGHLRSKKIRQILEEAIQPMLTQGADTLVLGCTHYPFVLPLIRSIAGEQVTVIDPSPAIARRVKFLLDEKGILAQGEQAGSLSIYTTGNPRKLFMQLPVFIREEQPVHALQWVGDQLEKTFTFEQQSDQVVEVELKDVTQLTADAIGKPGARTFFLQGVKGDEVVTLLIEKIQLQGLTEGAEQFLEMVLKEYPELPKIKGDYDEENMRLRSPFKPLFRVGDIGVAFDSELDRVCLIAKELMLDQPEDVKPRVVRLWCTRSQWLALARRGQTVIHSGRPICPQCQQPMEPEGHFCPKKNGRKH